MLKTIKMASSSGKGLFNHIIIFRALCIDYRLNQEKTASIG